MSSQIKRPFVGVGAVIFNEKGQILMGKRRRSPEAGHWSILGGKVDYMETIEAATIREIKEEAGVDIVIDKLLGVTNHILPNEQIHYVAPTFLAHIINGEAINQEPEALERLIWADLTDLPQPLTLTTLHALAYLDNDH